MRAITFLEEILVEKFSNLLKNLKTADPIN